MPKTSRGRTKDGRRQRAAQRRGAALTAGGSRAYRAALNTEAGRAQVSTDRWRSPKRAWFRRG